MLETPRTAVVTGGAKGIGRAIATHLVASDINVLSLDIDDKVLVAPVAPGAAKGIGLVCDITDPIAVAEAASVATRELGRVSYLVNNAGIASYADPTLMTDADWERFFAVDLKAAWVCAKQFLPAMLEDGYGSIVNITSIHGRLTLPGMFPYAAAKAGLEGLTRSLALDVAARGVRVNALAPGYVRTELSEEWIARQERPEDARKAVDASIPQGRMAEPAEIAAVVAFLLGPASSAITGATIPVDGGLGVRFAT